MDENVFSKEAPNTEPMTFEKAKSLLDLCERFECRDHAFGDRELFWSRGEVEVAGGYFGSTGRSVWIEDAFGGGSFEGDEARELSTHGKKVTIERNDETGPDYYEGS